MRSKLLCVVFVHLSDLMALSLPLCHTWWPGQAQAYESSSSEMKEVLCLHADQGALTHAQGH